MRTRDESVGPLADLHASMDRRWKARTKCALIGWGNPSAALSLALCLLLAGQR
jgi:hypothetical protein